MAVSERRDELRCVCGLLLARATEEGLELRCRRCKRAVVIPYEDLPGAERVMRFFEEWKRYEVKRRP